MRERDALICLLASLRTQLEAPHDQVDAVLLNSALEVIGDSLEWIQYRQLGRDA